MLKDYHKEIDPSTFITHLVETFVGVVVPSPSVDKRLRLCVVFAADVVVNLIVVSLGIKRRVNITKINRFIADKAAENVEVVAVKEFVHFYNIYCKSIHPRKDLSKLFASE